MQVGGIDVGSAPTSKQALAESIMNAAKARPASPQKTKAGKFQKAEASGRPRAFRYQKRVVDDILLCFEYHGQQNGGWVSSDAIWMTLNVIQKGVANPDSTDKDALNARLTALETAAQPLLELSTAGTYKLSESLAIVRLCPTPTVHMLRELDVVQLNRAEHGSILARS